jgi:predicted ATP-grasp superfamily ATP-dependent carboligase
MPGETDDLLRIHDAVQLPGGTLVLAFTGWMDGGDASTGTVRRFVEHLAAPVVAEIDPDPFYLFNFPGPMELAALFRPHIAIEGGLIEKVQLPASTFYAHASGNLALFIGREPNLRWPTYRDCIFRFAHQTGVTRILFVGSFGGAVPHTREPRMFITCSERDMLPEMERYGVGRTDYNGPGSFSSYLLTESPAAGLRMASLVAEIPGYLQGTNPACLLAITRRLATILGVAVDLNELRQSATAWELHVSSAVEQKEELAQTVRQLEEDYDRRLIEQDEERG